MAFLMKKLGVPGSKGCIYAHNKDIVELFSYAPAGTLVWIQQDSFCENCMSEYINTQAIGVIVDIASTQLAWLRILNFYNSPNYLG